jgi:hypothetical protein
MGDFLKLTPSISSDPPLEFDNVRKRWRSKLVKELLLAMFSFSACMPRMFGGVENVGGGVGGMLKEIVSQCGGRTELEALLSSDPD